jgi:hypothetical protein
MKLGHLLVRTAKAWPRDGLPAVMRLLVDLLKRYPSEPHEPSHMLPIFFFQIAAGVRSPWLPELVRESQIPQEERVAFCTHVLCH